MVKDMKPGYLELLDLFVTVTTTNKPNIKKLSQEFVRTGMKIAIAAPDVVVKRYIYWRGMAMIGDAEKMVNAFAELLLSIRKDIDPNTACTVDDMLDMFIQED